MDYYRLEYSENQGRFHFSNGAFPTDTNGWQTICNVLSVFQCSEFAQLIVEKYPSTNPSLDLEYPRTYPSFEVVKQEFIDFLLT